MVATRDDRERDEPICFLDASQDVVSIDFNVDNGLVPPV
jgi:hypothetical protein